MLRAITGALRHVGGRSAQAVRLAPQAGLDVLFRQPAPWAAPGLASALGGLREKQTKRQSYWKHPRAKPCGQRVPKQAHVGPKALPSEYVEVGKIICRQRKYLAKNPFVTRKRHFKYYPGLNVKVHRTSSLQAAVSGRVKMTHDVRRDVMIMNVLAEPREELVREDLWRYRTEHVECMEENTELCVLRAKALPVFGKEGGWVNQPVGPRPMRARISDLYDRWNNPTVRDPLEMEPFNYPLGRQQLARHIQKVRARQRGVPEEQNDPEFQITDVRFHRFKGQSAQR
mmetsp:Transcript_60178/g.140641  ORF Transcript_60178/g.140641 Transcript_60178/m.140641 type:complete len:285 (+) Transcript_60178:71-925(+)